MSDLRTHVRPLRAAKGVIFESPRVSPDPPSRLPEMLNTVADYVTQHEIDDGDIDVLLITRTGMADNLGPRWEAYLYFEESVETNEQGRERKALLEFDDNSPVVHLYRLMRKISRQHFSQDWRLYLEHILWEAVNGGRRRGILRSTLDDLRMLADKAGGWVVWDDQAFFVPMEEWVTIERKTNEY